MKLVIKRLAPFSAKWITYELDIESFCFTPYLVQGSDAFQLSVFPSKIFFRKVKWHVLLNLRKALFSAALVASQCDTAFCAFYQKKVSEGKHHLTVLGAVSRKLCYVIHAILTKNEHYKIVPD